MSTQQLLKRDEFREGVFARDMHRCVFCGEPAQDAHHILERRLFTGSGEKGGYFLNNGASVCGLHHIMCEQTKLTVEQVREACGITSIVVPEDLYDSEIYDKWGNPVLEDGRRGMGPLFFDESVQKILKEGGVLDLFTPYVKYPRTFHLPGSPGIHDDDKALRDTSQFHGKRVIISKKMDGENTTAYSDMHIHARSIDSKGGEDRAWVKQFLSNIIYDLPQGWRICGENLWAEHSIHYNDLRSYFYGFSLWNEKNICLSWDETIEYFQILGVHHVPVMYDGIWDDGLIKEFGKDLHQVGTPRWQQLEGFVVRVADAFPFGQFRNSVAKFVRAGHIQTTKHWRAGRQFTPNELKK